MIDRYAILSSGIQIQFRENDDELTVELVPAEDGPLPVEHHLEAGHEVLCMFVISDEGMSNRRQTDGTMEELTDEEKAAYGR